MKQRFAVLNVVAKARETSLTLYQHGTLRDERKTAHERNNGMKIPKKETNKKLFFAHLKEFLT